MQPHPSQLAICHHLIDADVRVHEGKQERRRQWCNLAAHAWCFDDEFYVCTEHLAARHARHRVQLVTAEKAAKEPPERRHGERRK